MPSAMAAEASSSSSIAPPSESSTVSPYQGSTSSPRAGPSTTTSVSSPRHQLFPPLAPPAAPSTTSTSASALQPTLPSAEQQQHVAEARSAVVASISNLLDSELQSRATVLHSNAAALDKQERDVVRATDGLRRENDKLAKFSAEGARRVKELGNVQYWAEVLEREFLVLEETMRLVRRGSASSGSGSWSGSGTMSWSGSEVGDDEDDAGKGHGGAKVARDPGGQGARLHGKEGAPEGDHDVKMDEDTEQGGARLHGRDVDKGKRRDVGEAADPDAMQLDSSDTSASAAELDSSHTRGSDTTSLSTTV
ncbi:hypothetical protein F5X68DRAFT_205881 [Plectosphaerella plurivora]|uniref:Biogenesis of lysosome-related organelles complex 1 subunit 1 n=1 Tax=Plectosphaerella plurivora TaxID=936078 RepID=A0A9P8VDS4_9PEZI|nr:hypothetical protein F5X68DRAFT_205881 [Plectosphaerella plurivora]